MTDLGLDRIIHRDGPLCGGRVGLGIRGRLLGVKTVSNRVPRGYYVDPSGALKRERRRSSDRRSPGGVKSVEDRRNKMRRASDRLDLDREHHEMIEDALEEFVAEHQR